jgi:hypothetical protein
VGLSFFDPRRGALSEFHPASPPRVGIEARPGNPREDAVHSALTPVLAFLGLTTEPGLELRVGGDDPGPGRVWLKAAPLSGDAASGSPDERIARGFSPEDFAYLCLKTHYRTPLVCSWEALGSARSERAELLRVARALGGVSLEPSASARAGYLHRFREALSRDLDLPGALDCAWDALRPGALSQGSKASLLREVLPALGLRA